MTMLSKLLFSYLQTGVMLENSFASVFCLLLLQLKILVLVFGNSLFGFYMYSVKPVYAINFSLLVSDCCIIFCTLASDPVMFTFSSSSSFFLQREPLKISNLRKTRSQWLIVSFFSIAFGLFPSGVVTANHLSPSYPGLCVHVSHTNFMSF